MTRCNGAMVDCGSAASSALQQSSRDNEATRLAVTAWPSRQRIYRSRLS